MVLSEKSEGQSYYTLSSGDHECLCQISQQSIWDISVDNKNVNLLVELEGESQVHKSQLDPSSGDHKYVQNLI